MSVITMMTSKTVMKVMMRMMTSSFPFISLYSQASLQDKWCSVNEVSFAPIELPFSGQILQFLPIQTIIPHFCSPFPCASLQSRLASCPAAVSTHGAREWNFPPPSTVRSNHPGCRSTGSTRKIDYSTDQHQTMDGWVSDVLYRVSLWEQWAGSYVNCDQIVTITESRYLVFFN